MTTVENNPSESLDTDIQNSNKRKVEDLSETTKINLPNDENSKEIKNQEGENKKPKIDVKEDNDKDKLNGSLQNESKSKNEVNKEEKTDNFTDTKDDKQNEDNSGKDKKIVENVFPINETTIKELMKTFSDEELKEFTIKIVLENSNSKYFQDFLKEVDNDRNRSRVFVRLLELKKNEEHILKEAFSQFGEVVDATVVADRKTGKTKGIGFVTFTNARDAATAISAKNVEVKGKMTNCHMANPRQNNTSNNRTYNRFNDQSYFNRYPQSRSTYDYGPVPRYGNDYYRGGYGGY